MPVIAARRAGLRKQQNPGFLANDPLTGTGLLDGSTVVGTSPTKTWAFESGIANTWQRTGSGASPSAASSQVEYVTFDTGLTSYTITMTWQTLTALARVVFRSDGSGGSRWSVGNQNGADTSVYVFQQVGGGAITTLNAGAAIGTLAAGQPIKVVVTPTAVTVFLNGVQVWTSSDTTLATATHVGLIGDWLGVSAPVATNFRVTSP